MLTMSALTLVLVCALSLQGVHGQLCIIGGLECQLAYQIWGGNVRNAIFATSNCRAIKYVAIGMGAIPKSRGLAIFTGLRLWISLGGGIAFLSYINDGLGEFLLYFLTMGAFGVGQLNGTILGNDNWIVVNRAIYLFGALTFASTNCYVEFGAQTMTFSGVDGIGVGNVYAAMGGNGIRVAFTIFTGRVFFDTSDHFFYRFNEYRSRGFTGLFGAPHGFLSF